MIIVQIKILTLTTSNYSIITQNIFEANMNKKVLRKTQDNVIYLNFLKSINKHERDELYDFISDKLLLKKEDIMKLLSR